MERYYPYVKKLIQVLRLERLLEKDQKTKEMVEVIYRRQDKRKQFAEIWYRRILMLLAVLGVCGLFFLVCVAAEGPPDVIVEGRYIRTGQNEDLVTFGFRAQTEEGMAEEELTVDITADEEEEQSGESAEIEITPRERMVAAVQEAVENAVEEQKGEERIELPGEVSGTRVEYINPGKEKDFSAFYLSLSVLILLPFLWKRQEQQKLQEREIQLSLDYPELVNKIVLLLNAGLTVRGCFERLGKEYTRKLEETGKKRYAYEEVCVAWQEMKNGVSEAEAVEAFGRRCRQLPYLKFSSIINQNLRKGTEGLTALLEVEVMEAFEKRKETVKRMGETAGTKLLLPMILMLGVVIAIIVIPAFMTM